MMTANNPLRRLKELGQSVWLDHIRRDLIAGGGLAKLIVEDGVSGVTSNPTIFENALFHFQDYRQAIADLLRDGAGAMATYEVLALGDIRQAADILRPTYDASDGRDGFVSIEVSPYLAFNAEESIAEARRLWALLDRPNVLIKIPATREGIAAITQLLRDGINVNATLLFGIERYREVAEAYQVALEERINAGLTVGRLVSVASFFVSRIDVLVDRLLDHVSPMHSSLLVQALRGEAAIASARTAYEYYCKLQQTARWRELAAQDARPQRLLWASTGTKGAAYSDVKYVDALVGADTITTLPLATLEAYRNHGRPHLRLAEADATPSSQRVLESLADLGIDMREVAERLEREGVQKFVQAFEQMLVSLDRMRTEAVAQPAE